ncbi:hypothetical protein BH09VER1_BH09VER1_51370 [soil metagenome]
MLFALAAFLILLILGIVKDEIRALHAAAFLVLAIIAFLVVGFLEWPLFAYATFIALLDIILILLIFKGDVRIR